MLSKRDEELFLLKDLQVQRPKLDMGDSFQVNIT